MEKYFFAVKSSDEITTESLRHSSSKMRALNRIAFLVDTRTSLFLPENSHSGSFQQLKSEEMKLSQF